MRHRVASIVALGALSVAACRSSSCNRGTSVSGSLLRASLPEGFYVVRPTESVARATLDAGGFMLRQSANPRNVIEVKPLPRLSVDPTDSAYCVPTPASAGAVDPIRRAEVRTIGGNKVCSVEYERTGSAQVFRGFTWLLSPQSKLGVIMVCELDPSDSAAEDACLSVVGSLSATETSDVASTAPSTSPTAFGAPERDGSPSNPSSNHAALDGTGDERQDADSPKGPATVEVSTPRAGTVPHSDRVIAAMRPRFRQCYQAGLAARPTSEGSVRVRATVAANGTIDTATAEAEGNVDASVARCIAGVVRAATFERPDGAAPVALSFSVPLRRASAP